MGFTLKVEGNTTIELGTTSITGVKVSTDIPQDSNARSTDLGSTITVTGKIRLTQPDSWAYGHWFLQKTLTATVRSLWK